MSAVWVVLFWRADYSWQSGRHGWLPVQLFAKFCLVWRLPAAGWQGCIMRCLAAEHRQALGLVLVHCWAESGSRKSCGWCLPTSGWMKPSPQTSASPLGGKAVSWGLGARPRGPRAGVGLLVCSASS